MADPFEVRLRFSGQLQNLNASVASARKAAAYALKHSELHEDLHSCILEQLEKTALNTRANIMYFLEHFLELAQRAGHGEYVTMLQRDIIRVVDAVAPETGQGAANVKVVRRVLQGLQQRGFLEAQAVTEIEEVLRERETALGDLGGGDGGVGGGGGPDGHGSRGVGGGSGGGSGGGGGNGGDSGSTRPGASHGPAGGHAHGGSHHAPAGRRLDKKQIEERIEEDRERHKRLRENIWAVPGGTDTEMWKLWEETSELGEDDHVMGEEEEAERRRNVASSCTHGVEA